jgi:thymidylate kinase
MLYIIEGAQGAGKTTLIQTSSLKDYYYHFSFSEHLFCLDITNPRDVWYFTMGKDLQFLEYTSKNPNQYFVTDRSFLSTIVYADLFSRINKLQIFDYLYYVAKNLLQQAQIVYIEGTNPNFTRQHQDGFDALYLQKSQQEVLYKQYISLLEKEYNIETIPFYNKFTMESITEFQRLINAIKGSVKK